MNKRSRLERLSAYAQMLHEARETMTPEQTIARVQAIYRRHARMLAEGETPTAEEFDRVRRIADLFDVAAERKRQEEA